MLRRLIRYAPVLDHIEQNHPTSILEVGSGCLGLGEFSDLRFIGCDLRFSGPVARCMIPVLCSGLALPFRDRTFDMVVSMDMLEHLCPPDRAQGLRELLRVADQYAVVGFPSGHFARHSDLFLARLVSVTGRDYPDWLSDHLERGLPVLGEIVSILDDENMTLSSWNNQNVALHFLLGALDGFLPFINRKLNSIVRRTTGFWHWLASVPILHLPPTYRVILVIWKNERG